ncbi:hypothetical protein [Xanthobacter agilis]|uniref:Uncharacterized protein n=1 Tax=Xanthobacter agilis TaxID=47492 RepID=A0ABU0LJW0_XANAG|nr:hypothetical protein [Xanthobacter agilis]MDQ0507374.1 hypothetical protein [Xanthobacter agilis]
MLIPTSGGVLRQLAAAGALDAATGAGWQVVIADLVEREACGWERGQPQAQEVLSWIESAGGAVQRVETAPGVAYGALLKREETPAAVATLERLRRGGGARAVRDFVEGLEPGEVGSVLVVDDDPGVATLMSAARVPVQCLPAAQALQLLAEQAPRSPR